VSSYSPDERLSDAQRGAISQLFQDGLAVGFVPREMSPMRERHIHLLDEAFPDDLQLEILASDLHNQLRWFRPPAYFLANAFQYLTQRRGSSMHVWACLLFADAQIACANDMSFHSLEVAWRALGAYQASAEAVEREWLETARDEVLSRLQIQHRFYAEWTRPFDYLDCNPLIEHMYTKFVIRSLREAYPTTTEPLSSRMPPVERASVLLETAETAHLQNDDYHWITGRRVAATELAGVGQIEAAEALYRACLQRAGEIGLEAEIGHLLRLHGWSLMQLGRLPEAETAMEEAIEHERPLALFGYWSALAFRELGDIRARMGRDDALDAYGGGRKALDAVLA
jgi:tetratricopeptide (TPR) repeat protein